MAFLHNSVLIAGSYSNFQYVCKDPCACVCMSAHTCVQEEEPERSHISEFSAWFLQCQLRPWQLWTHYANPFMENLDKIEPLVIVMRAASIHGSASVGLCAWSQVTPPQWALGSDGRYLWGE